MSAKRCKARRFSGFTLIEILVVISLISLLISILLPALQHARESARQVACASNERQTVLATLLYVHDSQGRFPLLCGPMGGSGPWVPTLIGPYLGNFDVLKCSSFVPAKCPMSIGYNWQLGPCDGNDFLARNQNPNPGYGTDKAGISYSLAEITSPTRVIVWGDAEGEKDPAFFENPNIWNPPEITYVTPPIWAWGAAPYALPAFGRHTGGMNVACADGHAAYVPGAYEYAADLGWHNGWLDWPERALTFYPRGPAGMYPFE